MKIKIFKFISILMALAINCQNIAWSMPAVDPQSSIYNLQLDNIYIPEKYGTIEKANSEWLMANGKKVVLIK